MKRHQPISPVADPVSPVRPITTPFEAVASLAVPVKCRRGGGDLQCGNVR